MRPLLESARTGLALRVFNLLVLLHLHDRSAQTMGAWLLSEVQSICLPHIDFIGLMQVACLTRFTTTCSSGRCDHMLVKRPHRVAFRLRSSYGRTTGLKYARLRAACFMCYPCHASIPWQKAFRDLEVVLVLDVLDEAICQSTTKRVAGCSHLEIVMPPRAPQQTTVRSKKIMIPHMSGTNL